MFNELKSDLKKRMEGALGALRHSLAGLRTGRASASLLEPIKVEAYGNIMPITQVATINVPEARMITVQVWDKAVVKDVEKAIINSGLGLNPSIEGQVIRVPIPDLSEERRKELAKKTSEYCEQSKIALRNIRRDGIDILKKMEKNKEISEDDLKTQTDEIQDLINEYSKIADDLSGQKAKEIMSTI